MVEGSQRETILVVDDDSYVRSLVVKILAQRGYTALPAADAWQAMDILQEQPIDLIILDLRMPGPVDGEQLLHALHDHGNKVPIIILSGWVNDEMSLNPPRRGAHGHEKADRHRHLRCHGGARSGEVLRQAGLVLPGAIPSAHGRRSMEWLTESLARFGHLPVHRLICAGQY